MIDENGYKYHNIAGHYKENELDKTIREDHSREEASKISEKVKAGYELDDLFEAMKGRLKDL